MFPAPVVIATPALEPIAVFVPPDENAFSALNPKAVLSAPVAVPLAPRPALGLQIDLRPAML